MWGFCDSSVSSLRLARGFFGHGAACVWPAMELRSPSRDEWMATVLMTSTFLLRRTPLSDVPNELQRLEPVVCTELTPCFSCLEIYFPCPSMQDLGLKLLKAMAFISSGHFKSAVANGGSERWDARAFQSPATHPPPDLWS